MTTAHQLYPCGGCGAGVAPGVPRCASCREGNLRRPLHPFDDSSFTMGRLGPPLLAVVAHGLPAPQGSKSTGISSKTGKAFTRESSKAVKPWRQDVVAAVLAAKPVTWVPLDGPVVLDLVFTMPRPQSAPKTRRVFPNKTPDIDKITRSTKDALKTAGLYTDDSRVIGFRRLREFYSGDPDHDALPAGETGAVIRAWELPILPTNGARP